MDSLGKLLRALDPSPKTPRGPACSSVSLLGLQKFKTGILDLLLTGHGYTGALRCSGRWLRDLLSENDSMSGSCWDPQRLHEEEPLAYG